MTSWHPLRTAPAERGRGTDTGTDRRGPRAFCLLLKVVNSQAYGPDVVELVGDVTRAAQAPAPAPTPRTSHRASG
ncbi:hypothetical protein [Streptomyces poriferorum]|uniref:Uncharacterized protein n=1 Tax=Streptomyces poriferorum TaxID=2798799 RepID=A0ABY9J5N4_9ACTN|nr:MULTISPECIES: hypothetical protein [unclassified Streptomyces]MDP5316890.1 hypothetical protein [Streptomyces sp. Alt4]WLQ61976.1 hypothetical protein P8A19_06850 [Streptomyces sp. Alt2]